MRSRLAGASPPAAAKNAASGEVGPAGCGSARGGADSDSAPGRLPRSTRTSSADRRFRGTLETPNSVPPAPEESAGPIGGTFMTQANRFALLPRLVLALWLTLSATGTDAEEPLRMTHVLDVNGKRIPVATEIFLQPAGQTRIAVKVAGNLGVLQRHLPGLLSRVVEDTCERRIGLEVNEVRAEGDHLRGRGRVQLIRYRCTDPEDLTTRRKTFSNISGVEFLLDGRIEDNCVHAYLEELSIAPSGLVGAILDLTRITGRVSEAVRRGLNDTVNGKDRCIDMPDMLALLDTHVTSGGFRDFGGGAMGVVMTGSVDVTAANFIALLRHLERSGALRQLE
jgi:hypothetical protein